MKNYLISNEKYHNLKAFIHDPRKTNVEAWLSKLVRVWQNFIQTGSKFGSFPGFEAESTQTE